MQQHQPPVQGIKADSTGLYTLILGSRMNTIDDLVDLEHAAADEAHVTGLPLEHCQQYVRRNAELIARLDAEAEAARLQLIAKRNADAMNVLMRSPVHREYGLAWKARNA